MKLRTSHSTIPFLIEEVAISLVIGGGEKLIDGKKVFVGQQAATAWLRELPVTVDFSYIPGWPATTNRDPDECEEGAAPEIAIKAVTPTLQAFMEVGNAEDEHAGAALVLDAGKCIQYLLTADQREAIETAIDKYMTQEVAL